MITIYPPPVTPTTSDRLPKSRHLHASITTGPNPTQPNPHDHHFGQGFNAKADIPTFQQRSGIIAEAFHNHEICTDRPRIRHETLRPSAPVALDGSAGAIFDAYDAERAVGCWAGTGGNAGGGGFWGVRRCCLLRVLFSTSSSIRYVLMQS